MKSRFSRFIEIAKRAINAFEKEKRELVEIMSSMDAGELLRAENALKRANNASSRPAVND